MVDAKRCLMEIGSVPMFLLSGKMGDVAGVYGVDWIKQSVARRGHKAADQQSMLCIRKLPHTLVCL